MSMAPADLRAWGGLVALLLGAAILALSGCGDEAKLPEAATMGPTPTLPDPHKTLIPTVKIATARGWSAGEAPKPAPELAVSALARNLDHPRWVYVLPNGDILVAETNAPPRPQDARGLRGVVYRALQRRAGAHTPSANRITLLRDVGSDGLAQTRTTFLEGLNSPFGMALIGQDFYVANTDAVVRFPYRPGDTQLTGPGVKVADLPAGPINHHWTKNILASPDGSRLYATVGSNSNVAENGLDKEDGRAAVQEIDLQSGSTRIFASGLRNPNGMDWEPETGVLWTVVNERDELGSDLVPDYLTSVKDGGFYGWPFSYFGRHIDTRVTSPRPDLVAKAIVPDYALGNHTASLGLVFATGATLSDRFRRGAFIGQHGSWNRRPFSGYKVIFIRFSEGRPSGEPLDVLTGFLSAKEEALGRPVGVAIDRTGALLVADDVGNIVWRVTRAPPRAAGDP